MGEFIKKKKGEIPQSKDQGTTPLEPNKKIEPEQPTTYETAYVGIPDEDHNEEQINSDEKDHKGVTGEGHGWRQLNSESEGKRQTESDTKQLKAKPKVWKQPPQPKAQTQPVAGHIVGAIFGIIATGAFIYAIVFVAIPYFSSGGGVSNYGQVCDASTGGTGIYGTDGHCYSCSSGYESTNCASSKCGSSKGGVCCCNY